MCASKPGMIISLLFIFCAKSYFFRVFAAIFAVNFSADQAVKTLIPSDGTTIKYEGTGKLSSSFDTAKNVKIFDKLPDGLKYIKHETAKGTFNPETGIWNIGDLTVDEESVTLYITTQALTVGEKINEAYITSDTLNLNNETYEQEEIDVFSSDDSEISGFVKHASAKMHETGNPIFLAMISIFLLSVPIIKR